MLRRRTDPLIWTGTLCLAGICASLAWIALTEKQLTAGGRSGISYSEGSTAVLLGFFWLAAALGFVGVGASLSRFRHLIWAGLALIWVSVVTWYALVVGV